MRLLSAPLLKASLLLLAMGLVVPLRAADKETPPPLIGLTKDQVISRLGDPRSQIKAGAGDHVFPKQKLTLRNGVVVEAEEISDEPGASKRPADAPAPAAAPAADNADAAKAGKPAPAPAPPAAPAPTDAATAAKGPEATPDAKPTTASTAGGGLEIKSVRPPSANAPRPVPRSATTSVATTPPSPLAMKQAAPPVTATTGPRSGSAGGAPATTSVVVAPVAPLAGQSTAAPSTSSTATPPATMPVEEKATATTPASDTAPETPGENQATKKKKAPPRRFFRRHLDDDTDLPGEALFNVQTIVFAVGIFGAVAYLIWRGRQRKLLLAVTSVSSTPFNADVPTDTGALFTADLLAKLEWKRFEELVAAYYIKTGVIAVRTKAGPDAPVHLRISWKGEAKPFACVQCQSNPPGLIRLAPLHALNDALTAAEIRRGYVVTNGKFNVEARDFAEEKHFTCLPGDLLLKKLNALPPAARGEIMQTITTGDYSTASCPKCDAKMVRTDDGGWRCPKCETVLAPRRV